MIDRTGQPRTDEEIDEAIDAVTTIAVKFPMVLPLFTVNAMCIRDCLIELRVLRMEKGAKSSGSPQISCKLTLQELEEDCIHGYRDSESWSIIKKRECYQCFESIKERLGFK
jgi:hypothetical protein